jgi:hypothetical protein
MGWPTEQFVIERVPLELTRGQIRALVVAHRKGFFRVPREAELVEVNEQLGSESPATSGKIRRAESAILDAILPEITLREVDFCPICLADAESLNYHLQECPENGAEVAQ